MPAQGLTHVGTCLLEKMETLLIWAPLARRRIFWNRAISHTPESILANPTIQQSDTIIAMQSALVAVSHWTVLETWSGPFHCGISDTAGIHVAGIATRQSFVSFKFFY